MIADYSSYLELLAAVYISMILDIDTLNALWYPNNYYKKIKDTLKKIMPEEENKLNSTIVEASKKNAQNRNARMRRKASFMFVLTSLLLFLLGYESSCGDNKPHESWYNGVAITYFLGILICFFCKKCFEKWNKTAIMVILLGICLIAFLSIGVSYPCYNKVSHYYPLGIVTLVTLPAILDVYSRWLFSSAYSGYLRNYVIKVKKDYDQALSALQHGDDTQMPRHYKKLINSSIFTSDNNKTLSDICIQGYIDIRNQRLKEISSYPKGTSILVSWIIYTCKRIMKFFTISFNSILNRGTKSSNKNTINDNHHNVVLNYQKEYDEYLIEKSKGRGRLSIKKFCQEHSYDPAAMITWLKNRKMK